jgi:hypothetical protein
VLVGEPEASLALPELREELRESVEDVVDMRRCLGISGISDNRVLGCGSAKGFTGSSKGFADAVGAKTAAQAGFCPSDCANVLGSKAMEAFVEVGGSTSRT